MTTPALGFRWASSLGVSVILFLIISFLYLMIGALTPIAYRRYGSELVSAFGLGFSRTSDRAAFGQPPTELVRQHPELMAMRVVVFDMFSGLYLALFVLHTAVTWFGLRRGFMWSLWTLLIADVALPLYYFVALMYFSRRLAPLTFADVPPYFYVPLLILPFAAAFGWANWPSLVPR